MALSGYSVQPGVWDYPGATVMEHGVNFCVFSRYAEKMELLLFERDDQTEPDAVIELDPRINRTFFFWHIFIEDLPDGTYDNKTHTTTRWTGTEHVKETYRWDQRRALT